MSKQKCLQWESGDLAPLAGPIRIGTAEAIDDACDELLRDMDPSGKLSLRDVVEEEPSSEWMQTVLGSVEWSAWTFSGEASERSHRGKNTIIGRAVSRKKQRLTIKLT
jgi:hypothetical protein